MRIVRRFIHWYIAVLLFLGVLHHIDHVLRYDHSGWPFRPEVTPFTSSLLVYPLAISILFSRQKWYRVTVAALLAAALLFAHVFLETPFDQYTTWATNASPFRHDLGHPNLLGIASPLLGMLSVGISLLLTVMVALLPFFLSVEREERGEAIS